MNPIYRFFISTDINLFSTFLSDTKIGYTQTAYGLSVNSAYNTSGRISVLPGDYIIVVKFASVAFYDENNNIVHYISGSLSTWRKIITVPDNSAYCRISVLVNDWYSIIVNSAKLSNPNYKDDMELEYGMETNQRFFRASLSSKLTFIRDDYNYIYETPFETLYVVIIEKSNDNGDTWAEYYRGKFAKTDCEFDHDDLNISVKPDTIDEYNDVLAGLEREYNLVTIAPVIERMIVQKRPLIQVYSPGDEIVSCFLGGTYWEQDANMTTSRRDLVEKYHFFLCNIYKEFTLIPSAGAPSYLAGTYTGRLSYISATQTYEGKFYLEDGGDTYYLSVIQARVGYYFGQFICRIYRSSDNVALYSFNINLGPSDLWENETFIMAATTYGPPGTYVETRMTTPHNIYARYLLDVESLRGVATYVLAADDIVENNRNYKRVVGYAIDIAYISRQSSIDPTEWGRMDNGRYYMPPYSYFRRNFYPIARSTWADTSIWFGFTGLDHLVEADGRKPYVLRDTYPLWSCINQLLKQFAPDIVHEGTIEYSQFLYGQYNPISYDSFKLYVSQKSNILAGEYTQPAQKAPATLQQFLYMLRDCFRCFWFIDNGKLRIEHISWFKNGGSYDSRLPVVGIDTTIMYNPRNSKQLSYDTTKWSFNKLDMPERFQFKWMDDLTLPFDGMPIDIKSKYVQQGKIENVNISVFSSDIDLMLLNPGAMNKDGFTILGAIRNESNEYEVPILLTTIDSIDYYLQNGYMAFMNLQPRYYIYDMPAREVVINGRALRLVEISRNLKQNIILPVGENDPNPIQLIKTEIGNGEIEKININLHSRSAKIILRYDTDTQK